MGSILDWQLLNMFDWRGVVGISDWVVAVGARGRPIIWWPRAEADISPSAQLVTTQLCVRVCCEQSMSSLF